MRSCVVLGSSGTPASYGCGVVEQRTGGLGDAVGQLVQRQRVTVTIPKLALSVAGRRGCASASDQHFVFTYAKSAAIPETLVNQKFAIDKRRGLLRNEAQS